MVPVVAPNRHWQARQCHWLPQKKLGEGPSGYLASWPPELFEEVAALVVASESVYQDLNIERGHVGRVEAPQEEVLPVRENRGGLGFEDCRAAVRKASQARTRQDLQEDRKRCGPRRSASSTIIRLPPRPCVKFVIRNEATDPALLQQALENRFARHRPGHLNQGSEIP